MASDAEAEELFREHRYVWQQKRVLQRIYGQEFFARLVSWRRKDGLGVEVGAGPGFFKEFFPEVVSTDLVWSPWLDLVADAQNLPFRTSSVSNIFGLDVLHHVATPMNFLLEAQRVLVPGGRQILIEPWITPFSYLVYRHFHQEDCVLSAHPSELHAPQAASAKKAFDSNQAIPYLLFGPRSRRRTLDALPGFSPLVIEPFCLFAYLLSMGFKPTKLLPEFFYPVVSKIERATLPLWRSLAALRVLIVLEKRAQA
jgi:SAM-dependent methyltransferase